MKVTLSLILFIAMSVMACDDGGAKNQGSAVAESEPKPDKNAGNTPSTEDLDAPTSPTGAEESAGEGVGFPEGSDAPGDIAGTGEEVEVTVPDDEEEDDEEDSEPATPAGSEDFGSIDDLAFSQLVWNALGRLQLTEVGLVEGKPYEGKKPHGEILETFESTTEIATIEGEILVKRNYVGIDGDDPLEAFLAEDKPEEFLDAITVMFKREKGYSKEGDDWFWAKYKPDGTLFETDDNVPMAGRVSACISCHAKDDFVHKIEDSVAVKEVANPRPPAGGDTDPAEPANPDVTFAQTVWAALSDNDITGPTAMAGLPYLGQAPHGEVLQTFEANLTVGGDSTRVLVKRNFADINPQNQNDLLGDFRQGSAAEQADWLKGITVMVKRPGFDPANEDWFWVQYNPNGSIASADDGTDLVGKAEACISCHSQSPRGDMTHNVERKIFLNLD